MQDDLHFWFVLQLWEESQISNSCLREDLAKVRDELAVTRKKLDSSMQVRSLFLYGLSDRSHSQMTSSLAY